MGDGWCQNILGIPAEVLYSPHQKGSRNSSTNYKEWVLEMSWPRDSWNCKHVFPMKLIKSHWQLHESGSYLWRLHETPHVSTPHHVVFVQGFLATPAFGCELFDIETWNMVKSRWHCILWIKTTAGCRCCHLQDFRLTRYPKSLTSSAQFVPRPSACENFKTRILSLTDHVTWCDSTQCMAYCLLYWVHAYVTLNILYIYILYISIYYNIYRYTDILTGPTCPDVHLPAQKCSSERSFSWKTETP